MTINQLTINTLTASRDKIDSCNVGLTGLYQDELRSPNLKINYTSLTKMSMRISIIFPDRVQSGTNISFTFPSTVPLTNLCTVYLGITPLNTVIPDFYPLNNTIQISPFASFILRPNISL